MPLSRPEKYNVAGPSNRVALHMRRFNRNRPSRHCFCATEIQDKTGRKFYFSVVGFSAGILFSEPAVFAAPERMDVL